MLTMKRRVIGKMVRELKSNSSLLHCNASLCRRGREGRCLLAAALSVTMLYIGRYPTSSHLCQDDLVNVAKTPITS